MPSANKAIADGSMNLMEFTSGSLSCIPGQPQTEKTAAHQQSNAK